MQCNLNNHKISLTSEPNRKCQEKGGELKPFL
uniref:Uncharacterized protein n=1 Tax=Anguilla anguilla TaxID=7936 RepID=A0A0E9Q347_ANGAN